MKNDDFVEVFSTPDLTIEITEAVKFEYQIFRLNEDARLFITLKGVQIPFDKVTFWDWLFWQTEDVEGITLENSDLIEEAEYEFV